VLALEALLLELAAAFQLGVVALVVRGFLGFAGVADLVADLVDQARISASERASISGSSSLARVDQGLDAPELAVVRVDEAAQEAKHWSSRSLVARTAGLRPGRRPGPVPPLGVRRRQHTGSADGWAESIGQRAGEAAPPGCPRASPASSLPPEVRPVAQQQQDEGQRGEGGPEEDRDARGVGFISVLRSGLHASGETAGQCASRGRSAERAAGRPGCPDDATAESCYAVSCVRDPAFGRSASRNVDCPDRSHEPGRLALIDRCRLRPAFDRSGCRRPREAFLGEVDFACEESADGLAA